MSPYWPEFLKVAIVHLLSAASPGPDFAVVLRQSLVHGRRTGVWTALGVGTAICLHVTYALLGIGVLLKSSPAAFTILKFAGASYLAWLGVKGLRAKKGRSASPVEGEARDEEIAASIPTADAAWRAGFMVNALNPKVTLFVVAIFAVVISPATPKIIQVGYGAWISFATIAWFSFVAHLFTRERLRRTFLAQSHWIDRVLGVVFLLFAAGLAFSSLR